ncbi:antibiotic biosynthesis monooxygenase [Halorussus gelatinilyticus]|uniref:Antibiotic biosynthesis monooxygenase n=1 Tax=Halorussus gelatinilyticus TaxID=2937524 RepID=A0A8U0IKE6_9EURY|nr:putative quinol monooxygenase [Halorussus gelatinilyticus]UPW01617.1 antibiotic biosynthesis monooxygenase [Halorussus gelatinilyticus]
MSLVARKTIVVHTTITFDAERRDEAIALVDDLVEQSRNEAGTVRYRAMTDIGDENTVRFFEQYEDEEAWTAHTESDHYRRFTDRLPELVDGTMETINLVDAEPNVHTFTVEDLAE